MARGINGLLITVDAFGATLQGTLYGTNGPLVDMIAETDVLRVFAKKVHLLEPVAALASNKFYLPATYGNNIAFIFAGGKSYFPGVDYTVSGALVTWLNPEISLHPTDAIVAFGPANAYTAKSFSYENINMASEFDASDVDHDNKPTIQLRTDWNPLKQPFDQNSIFLFKNKELYSPAIHFAYDPTDNKIIWENVGTAPNVLDKISVFYYNQEETLPFMLGEVLFRANIPATTDNQTSFSLAAVPYRVLKDTANVFYDKMRYAYREDFTINAPAPLSLLTESAGKLRPVIEAGGILDISYFSDGEIADTISLLHAYFDGTPGTEFEAVNSTLYYIKPLPPTGDPISNIHSLFFFRGVLAVNRYFTNYTGGLNTAVGLDFPLGTRWEWENNTENNRVLWYPEARTEPGEGLIPTVAKGDFLTWTAFTDEVSQNAICIEYHQRNIDTPNIVLSQEMAGGDKCIVWYNGQALFKEFNQFQVNPDHKTLHTFEYTPLADANPGEDTDIEDEIVVLYFTSEAYAALWKFDGITLGSNILAGNNITFNYAINSINSSFLFNNGIRIDNKDYEPGSNSKQIKTTNGEDLSSGSKIMLVHT